MEMYVDSIRESSVTGHSAVTTTEVEIENLRIEDFDGLQSQRYTARMGPIQWVRDSFVCTRSLKALV